MPPSGVVSMPPADVLRYEEVLTIIEAARSLGFRRFRITGGEPLVRRGVILFLRELGRRGICYSMTTNGVLLARFAGELRRAGLRRINVGLDTLDRATFRRITGSDALGEVLGGISAARRAGIETIKLNVVVMKGVNEGEIGDFIAWGRRARIDVRFIEFMPLYGEDLYTPLAPFIDSLACEGRYEPVVEAGGGPARCFRDTETGTMVGFILPRTAPFCTACNRLRLTADGILLPCLFSSEGVDARGTLREGGDVAGAIARAVAAKPEGHGLEMTLHRYAMHARGG